jgi:hypothetical protein
MDYFSTFFVPHNPAEKAGFGTPRSPPRHSEALIRGKHPEPEFGSTLRGNSMEECSGVLQRHCRKAKDEKSSTKGSDGTDGLGVKKTVP